VALVTAGILPADSDVTYERIGLSEADRERIRDDLRRVRMNRMFEGFGETEETGETEEA
jgi:hypothetical protein